MFVVQEWNNSTVFLFSFEHKHLSPNAAFFILIIFCTRVKNQISNSHIFNKTYPDMTTFSSLALIFPPEFISVVLLLFLALSSASSSVLHHQLTLTVVNWRQNYFKTFILNSSTHYVAGHTSASSPNIV